MFKDLTIKSVYRTEDDNLIDDFYIPVLTHSVKYDRAVGFFSSTILNYASKGLASLIKNNGKMRLIVGAEFDKEEYEAIEKGYKLKEISEELGLTYINKLENIETDLEKTRLDALSWLIANGSLEIKIAVRKKGMFHEKIGIMEDKNGDKFIFQGSANETDYALLPGYNFESINVFKSWNDNPDHFMPHINTFERLWNSKIPNTFILSFPNNVKSWLIKNFSQNLNKPTPEIESSLWNKLLNDKGCLQQNELDNIPQIPLIFHGNNFALKNHQKEALKSWQQNDFRGILAIVTGGGKTLTSIFGAVKIFESQKRLFLVIAVPYINLAEQWCENLKDFNIYPIKCYENKDLWKNDLEKRIYDYKNKVIKFVAVVVVQKTLQSEDFQRNIALLKDDDKVFFIGDECHHHSSINLFKSLPQNARFRIGLSATPNDYYNKKADERLFNYYGDIVYKFTLKDAMNTTPPILTPYKYYVHPVELTLKETDEYLEISSQISKLIASGADFDTNKQLSSLIFKRSRLLGKAENKKLIFSNLLSKQHIEEHTLFFCGDGTNDETNEDGEIEEKRQVSQVSEIAQDFGWKTSRFTSHENSFERKKILDNFKHKNIDALVAIKCLDEGFDIPACKTAFLLASARNPRQFVQRRGRILRKSPGKDFATIHDFLVFIPQDLIDDPYSKFERNLLIEELKRINEFAECALNRADTYTSLREVLKSYHLEWAV